MQHHRWPSSPSILPLSFAIVVFVWGANDLTVWTLETNVNTRCNCVQVKKLHIQSGYETHFNKCKWSQIVSSQDALRHVVVQ